MRAQKMRRFKSVKGFTLVELIVAMAIVAILVSIAIPDFSKWKEGYEISGQAQKVYFDMILARSTSIKNNNNVLVTFEADKNIYKVHNDTDNDGVEDSGEIVKSVNLENNVEFGYNPGLLDVEGDRVSSAISLAGGNTVKFNSRGQARNGGSIFLIHKNDIGISNDRLRSVNILEITGDAEILEYDADGQPGPWS
tara:strand:+ start:111 stop:695 length:585 start_codon:yes stop_codon:yes gene_type:complete